MRHLPAIRSFSGIDLVSWIWILFSYIVSFCCASRLNRILWLTYFTIFFSMSMQTMKWLSSDSVSSDSTPSAAKRRKVNVATFQKWKGDLDQEWYTLSWLDCETSGVGSKKTVEKEKLKCKVCMQFQSAIEHQRNYSDKWISGADSVRTYLRCKRLSIHPLGEKKFSISYFFN